ncbi:SAM-dependent methyltransferase [Streptomyces ipomoeae]|uniref:SAM-dependent methyltransferase n=1 Tax=Streptomyces ipomoeae TaxID=103232 RepID=UPI001146E67E|nr:SAM-dependent methyltransferase [Streptomyces ipomoeae]MDX2820896.1 SAM-dependent methyltransferase [Streptomyces ipomoeae]MDX2873392.1 SAM-dependent methyltransferase [Streptomyces ipomoeae]TQE40120.1 SAM-dependent methyltransferase [Streptomyces ipomoeae]
MSDLSVPRDEGIARIDRLRTDVSHSARIWNYWLGGKDHYTVDEQVGDQILSFVPALPRSAVADRKFLARAVRVLAAEAGIRQFLDIGTGLPTADNTHEVAQRVDPSCRIVYVDNDPIVLTHAHALLTSTSEGTTDYIEADVHDPEAILRGAAETLDFERPIAVTMLGVLNFVMDTDEAASIVHRLMDAVPSGSHLVISHPTTEVDGEAMTEAVRYWNSQGSAPMTLRSHADLVRLFDPVELLPPGIVSCSRWRPDTNDGEIVDVTHFGGVGRKR